MAVEKAQMSFFIAKVNNFPSFRQTVQTGLWACADKTIPPQPRDILTEAYLKGPVVIIFSVSNCHGWHGYAEMLNAPGKVSKNTESISDASENTKISIDEVSNKTVLNTGLPSQTDMHYCKNFQKVTTKNEKEARAEESGPGNPSKFHYFDIEWKLNYLEFGEQCLSSKITEDFYCIENAGGNKIQVNKCRNWQEVGPEVGEAMCEKMREYYDSLCKKRDERKQREAECHTEPFYKDLNVLSVQETWKKIVAQVEQELGKVLLACPFGSQRYNLHTPDSDTDMFIVYQAKTRDILSFHPPKQTIKNHVSESCDYTIHEVYRYCELLLSGDARCVETLFLHDSTVVQASPEWHLLKQGRKMFLNKECLEKYLRDAQGSKGTKFLQKWCKDHSQELVLPAKLCKMLYVIVRLLQNARDIVIGEDLRVYRENGSADREVLMSIRRGDVPVAEAWKIINELETSIVSGSAQVEPRSEEAERYLEDWLLDIRHRNFQNQ